MDVESEVDIRIDHTDDSMSITVYRPGRHQPLTLAQTSEGIEPVFAEHYGRRYRRAERPSTDVLRAAAEESERDWADTERDLINWSYS